MILKHKYQQEVKETLTALGAVWSKFFRGWCFSDTESYKLGLLACLEYEVQQSNTEDSYYKSLLTVINGLKNSFNA